MSLRRLREAVSYGGGCGITVGVCLAVAVQWRCGAHYVVHAGVPEISMATYRQCPVLGIELKSTFDLYGQQVASC